jgi:hypothetical protein
MLIRDFVALARHSHIRFIVQPEVKLTRRRILRIVLNVKVNDFKWTIRSGEQINLI